MTIKGQITIPGAFRKIMKLKPSTKLSVSLDERAGEIKVKPLPDFFELAHSMKLKNKKDVMKARDIMENTYGRF